MTEPAQWKIDFVKNLEDEINSRKVAAIVSIKGLRNNEFQKIRNSIRDKARIKVSRARLLRLAIENTGKNNIVKLKDYAHGQVALITTDESPKKIYDILEKSKTKAPAKGGEIAEEDIVIEPKETNFPPGPKISEFQKAGLPAAIEKGKIVIKSEVTFVKKGDVITREKALVLKDLEIYPITAGLDLIAAYEDGLIFNKDVLSISDEKIMSDLASAFLGAKSLAIEANFIVPEIVPDMISKAYLEAQSLAIEANFVDEKNIDIFIRKAFINASAIEALINKDLNNEDITDKKEEKAEEKETSSDEDAASGLGALFG
ncbi:50S ribosomal protein L10 [Picrophilus oshimae]|uniref:Large ribosomal subunit protein uL10 n=1 Tax=Picrophilus torridus (strain ATCC 700027 / DSM 9790 / JCM 10055 / NBRC 100828 / KAW 2/3) TaxID=1122961 RepID=A0A8G2L7U8_PICTO|nr:50S ribosomal protein L10 [Picrophilus oshimae]SMD30674.1 LSU ribosomal protein L10P [Picrophilus oshimae DSM 9789]